MCAHYGIININIPDVKADLNWHQLMWIINPVITANRIVTSVSFNLIFSYYFTNLQSGCISANDTIFEKLIESQCCLRVDVDDFVYLINCPQIHLYLLFEHDDHDILFCGLLTMFWKIYITVIARLTV